MAVTLTLRTDADGHLVSSLDGETLAVTPLAALPALERLQADPFHVGAALTAALGGATLLPRLDADPERLLLLDCDTRADAIPWEFAALPAQAFVAQYGMLRSLDLSPQPPSRIGKGEQNSPLLSGEGMGERLQFVALAADPLVDEKGEPREGYRLRVEDELVKIRGALRESHVALHAQRIPPTKDALRRALYRGPAILHLTCHGDVVQTDDGARAVLSLEDENGGIDALLGNDLVVMPPRGVLRVVLLSACHTAEGRDAHLARTLVQSGVPFAIGMQGAFPDSLSDELAVAFYATLLVAGHSLAEALRQARQSLVRFTDEKKRFAFGLPVGYTAREGWQALPLTKGEPQIGGLGLPGIVDFAGQVHPPRPLLGRNRELHDLAQLYSSGAKVVTVTGTGGIGKTALAASFAERFAWRWREGVRAISFASEAIDARTFRSMLLRALRGEAFAQQLADADAEKQTGVILQTLRDWDGLLLLDNYESVLQGLAVISRERSDREISTATDEISRSARNDKMPDEAAEIHRLVAQMAEGGAAILLTSREQPAGLRGEVLFPKADAPLSGLALRAGAQLFLEYSTKARGQRDSEQFALEIARVTDGHPLAIALLAGEYDVSNVSPADFLKNWGDELAHATRAGLARHHVTFATAFERSYNHLTADEQRRLRALSVFAFPFYEQGAVMTWKLEVGGSKLEVSEQELKDAREELGKFTRRNLLEIDGWFEGGIPSAYRFQPALRQEAARRVREDERAALANGYAAYTYWFAEMAFDQISREPAVARRAQQAASELIAQVDAQPADRLARYCWLLGFILQRFGRITDAENVLARGAASAEEQGDDARRARIFVEQANVAVLRGDLGRALSRYQESVQLFERLGDQQGKGATLHQMAQILVTRGDLDRAMGLYQQSLQTAEQRGDLQGKAATLHEMAGIYQTRGDLDRAMELYQQSLQIKEQLGDLQGKAATLHQMAWVYVTRGDLDRAMGLYQQSLQIEEQLGNLQGKAATLHNMAGIYVTRGDLDRAMGLYQQSLVIKEQLGDLQGKSTTLSKIADVQMARGKWNEAEQTILQSLACAREVGYLSDIAFNTVKLGQLAQARGDRAGALARYREGLAIFERLGMPRETAQVREMIAELERPHPQPLSFEERGDAADPLAQAIAQARAAAERGDIQAAIAAQEQVVALVRQQGENEEAQQILVVQLANLANFYGAADSLQDAVRVLEEAAVLGECVKHPQLDTVRQMLEGARRAVAMSPEQRARAQPPSAADLQAQLDALPPEQRAQAEAALRQLQARLAQMSPQERAQWLAAQQDAARRAQIETLANQVRDAGIAAQRGEIPREQVLPQLEQLVQQIEQNESDNPPWMELVGFVRAVVVVVRGRASLIIVPGRETIPPVPAAYAAHLAAIQSAAR